jgi:hypothetical protein
VVLLASMAVAYICWRKRKAGKPSGVTVNQAAARPSANRESV